MVFSPKIQNFRYLTFKISKSLDLNSNKNKMLRLCKDVINNVINCNM